MRELVNTDRIRRFMRELALEVKVETKLYFTGGATAVLLGWRSTTIDVDIRFFPETDRVFRALPRLKERLQLNVELASPADFIPELPGWEERSQFISREGKLSFYHYDFYAQALSKIERGHAQDLNDVQAMFDAKLIESQKLFELYERIEPDLYRYPALDPKSFRRKVEDAVRRD
jgi:hypothetical protein